MKNTALNLEKKVALMVRKTHQNILLSHFLQIPPNTFYRKNAFASTPAPVINGKLFDYRDGQRYKVVKIGNKIWMAKNLNLYTPDSWWYDDDSKKGKRYGRLYTYNDAMVACPPGWHIPNDEEWKALLNHFGGYFESPDGNLVSGS